MEHAGASDEDKYFCLKLVELFFEITPISQRFKIAQTFPSRIINNSLIIKYVIYCHLKLQMCLIPSTVVLASTLFRNRLMMINRLSLMQILEFAYSGKNND